MEEFWNDFWTLPSIVWVIIGVALSVIINLNWYWIMRKWLGIRPWKRILFYDASMGDVIKSREGREDNHLFRFIAIRDKATATITFKFTDYYHQPTSPNKPMQVNKVFTFPFYRPYKSKTEDFITLYKQEKYKEFIEDIFWDAEKGKLGDTVKSAKKILGVV